MSVSGPAQSRLLASASTPPRCDSRCSATTARSNTSCLAPLPRFTMKPVPHASWSGWPCENIVSMVFDKLGGEKREIENLDSYYLNFDGEQLHRACMTDVCQARLKIANSHFAD